MLFPKGNFQQSVLSQTIITKPKYDYFSDADEKFVFEWDSVSEDKISFKIDTDLKIKNDFPKVAKTVSFPLSSFSQDIEKYTYETQHIDVNDDIRSKANELAAGETDLFIIAYKMGAWVKDRIKYDLNTLTAEADQKASWVFTNKKGVCDEITNLFIAMLRSINIPARFVSGVVYSNLDNSFGNHGWAEVYFPDYGWIPFDVTFGQYGWVDPTHLKLDDSYDSGASSVSYHWRSRNIEVKAESLEFKTEIKQKNGRLSPYTDMRIRPLKDEVGFGSYLPIEVAVENLKDYYLPLTIFITKAPELVEKNNAQYFVLKPLGKKRFYWLVKIPSDLNEEYIYTSDLEVKDIFGTTALDVVQYTKDFEVYAKEWAEETMDHLMERETKFFFANIDLNCNPDKDSYYSIENASIVCSVLNAGNVPLEDVNVCLAEECKKISLGIGEKESISFVRQLTQSETVTVSAENKDMVRYVEFKLNVIEVPDLQIVDVKPESIGYNEAGMLTFSLVTGSPAYNVKLDIKNLGVAKWEKLSDDSLVQLPFEGRDFSSGFIKIQMGYEDALNKTYAKTRNIPLLVTNIPMYVKAWNWLKNLF